MADMQLGAYATFSGFDEAAVAEYAARDMRVRSVPAVEGFEWDARRYEAAVAMVNASRPDLVVIGGDMVDDPNSEDQYDEFMRITHRIDGDIAVHWIPGNHDLASDAVVPTPQSLADYRAAFGPDFFAFDHGPLRFVALNTTALDRPEEIQGEVEEQFDFLAEELNGTAGRGRETILLGHHPLFLESADEPASYWNLASEPRRRILELAHRHGVRLVLAGHWHRNCLARDGDLQMVTTGAVGYPLGVDPSGFRLVEVAGGSISHSYRALADEDADHRAEGEGP
jgi:3',5'-cyclic AMP phosphodiesterase CpdA